MENIMPKLTFICEHEHPVKKEVVSTITYQSNREYLGDILEDIRDFLRGCGFAVDGEIDIVNDECYTKDGEPTYDSILDLGSFTFGSGSETVTPFAFGSGTCTLDFEDEIILDDLLNSSHNTER